MNRLVGVTVLKSGEDILGESRVWRAVDGAIQKVSSLGDAKEQRGELDSLDVGSKPSQACSIL